MYYSVLCFFFNCGTSLGNGREINKITAMKNSKFKTPAISILVMLVLSPVALLAQAPPPPGVPLDFGLSGLVAACVSYGYYKLKKND